MNQQEKEALIGHILCEIVEKRRRWRYNGGAWLEGSCVNHVLLAEHPERYELEPEPHVVHVWQWQQSGDLVYNHNRNLFHRTEPKGHIKYLGTLEWTEDMLQEVDDE